MNSRREFMSLVPLPFLRGTPIEPKVASHRAIFKVFDERGDELLRRSIELRRDLGILANVDSIDVIARRSTVLRGYLEYGGFHSLSRPKSLMPGDVLRFLPGSLRVEF